MTEKNFSDATLSNCIVSFNADVYNVERFPNIKINAKYMFMFGVMKKFLLCDVDGKIIKDYYYRNGQYVKYGSADS